MIPAGSRENFEHKVKFASTDDAAALVLGPPAEHAALTGNAFSSAGLFAHVHMSAAAIEQALTDEHAAMTARCQAEVNLAYGSEDSPAIEDVQGSAAPAQPDPWADYAEHAELVPYGPGTDAVRQVIESLSILTPAEAERWAAAHREVWGYAEGRPADHPDRLAAWDALRTALEAAERVLPGDLGPAYLDTRKALTAAGMDVVRWPVLDVAMSDYAADLEDEATGWNRAARLGLLRPWELWLGGWPVVPAESIGRDPR